MNKLLSFLIIVTMLISLVACGGTDTKKDSIDTLNETQENNNESSNNVDNSDIDIDEDNTSDSIKSAPLPENYPQDLIPLIDGSKVDYGHSQVNNGTEEVFIRLYSIKSPNETLEFYRDTLSDQTDINESEFAGIFTIECMISSKDITIDILKDNEYDGYPSLVRITILEKSSSNQDVDNVVNDSSTIENPNSNLTNEDKIPENYPLELVPIYSGSTIYDSGIFEMQKEMFYLNCYSNDDYKTIINFYKNLFSNIENKEEVNLDSDSYQISGDIDSRHILISIYKEDPEDTNFESFFSIHVDK